MYLKGAKINPIKSFGVILEMLWKATNNELYEDLIDFCSLPPPPN